MPEKDSDLFISYSSKDRKFVERLARDLLAVGVRIWWDKGEMKIGDSLNKKIQEGIAKSSWLAVVLSPNSVASPWVERELSAALIRELENRDVYILPILLESCSIPIFLSDKIYADFRISYVDGLETLLERLAPAINPKVVEALMSDKRESILSAYAKIPSRNRLKYHEFLSSKLLNASSSSSEIISILNALFTIKHPELESYLLMMAKHASVRIRRRAIFYIGEIRAKHAMPIISGYLSDGNPDVRVAAREAYRKITGDKLLTKA